MKYAAFIAANYAALYAVAAFVLWDWAWIASTVMDERIEFLVSGVVACVISAVLLLFWDIP